MEGHRQASTAYLHYTSVFPVVWKSMGAVYHVQQLMLFKLRDDRCLQGPPCSYPGTLARSTRSARDKPSSTLVVCVPTDTIRASGY